MIGLLREIQIKNCFCDLKIILYRIFFGQVNPKSFSLILTNLSYIQTINFACKRAIRCLGDQFLVLLAN